jgi:putative transcriptional regulator
MQSLRNTQNKERAVSKMFSDLKQGLVEVDAFLSGQREGFKVTIPDAIDVKEIRSRLNMTQLAFSSSFGFSLDAVKHWEGGRRTPEAPIRAFLTVIARDPKAVLDALHLPKKAKSRTAKLAHKRKASTAKAAQPAL